MTICYAILLFSYGKFSVLSRLMCSYVHHFINTVGFADITLRAYGPNGNGSFVSLCPDDDYILVFNCMVENKRVFEWNMAPLVRALLVESNVQPGKFAETMSYSVIIITSNELTQTVESQLQVSTRDILALFLHQSNPLAVSCGTLGDAKSIIVVQVAERPFRDIEAYFNKPTKKLIITWQLTYYESVVNVVICVKNAITAIELIKVVESNESRVYFDAMSDVPYDVTITAYDICQRSTSVSQNVQPIEGESKSAVHQTSRLLVPEHSISPSQCHDNNRGMYIHTAQNNRNCIFLHYR